MSSSPPSSSHIAAGVAIRALRVLAVAAFGVWGCLGGLSTEICGVFEVQGLLDSQTLGKATYNQDRRCVHLCVCVCVGVLFAALGVCQRLLRSNTCSQ